MPKKIARKRKNRPANKDLADLLVSTSDFRKDVESIRKHIGLPFDGFNNDEARKKFYDELNKRDFAVLESRAFINQTAEIERKYRDHKIDERTYTLQKRFYRDKYWLWYLQNMTEYLCYKYNLPYTFKDYLEKFILSDDRSNMSYPVTNYTFSVSGYEQLAYNNIHSVSVNVYSKLTHEDMGQIKKMLVLLSKKLPSHPRIKDMKKKLKYEEWNMREKQYSGEHIPLTDIAKTYLGSKKKVHTIHNAVRELKTLRTKRLKRPVVD